MKKAVYWTLGGALVSLLYQAPTARTLPPADAKLGAEFSRIVGLRELADGRVLVADLTDKRVVVADFAKNSVTEVGHVGHGPAEYASVSRLFALGGDSTLMNDVSNGRWQVFRSDKILGAFPPDHPAVRASKLAFRGSDTRGDVLATMDGISSITGGTQAFGPSDSARLIYVSLSTGRVDTVGKIRMPTLKMQSRVDNAGKPTSVNITVSPFSVGEEPILLPDGWLAIARLDPYRVDWRSPDGRWTLGKPLPFTIQLVSAREKEAWIARRTIQIGRAPQAVNDDAWPLMIPPFQSLPLLAGPGGAVLVARTQTATHPGNRYDIVDRTGHLTGWLDLPASERIAGVGTKSVYVVVTDDDGIQRLQRHALP